MAEVWFALLGPVQATVGGRPVRISRAQRRAVLAYLLWQANRTVSVDELVDALWGDTPPATARSQVFAAVSEVRRAARAAGHDPVVRSAGGYRIDAAEDTLDLAAFHSLVTVAHRHAEERQLDRAVSALQSALGLWLGSPLSGVTGAFVEQARAGLHERRVGALEQLYRYELAAGRHEKVLAELTEAVGAYPYSEVLVAHLMLALYRSGRPADALAAYRRTRQVLVDELGIEPTPELERLHRRMLDNDPQLRHVADGTPAGRRRYVPRDIPDFTGREADLCQLDEIAGTACDTAGAVVISAIGGVAGVGKTALATRWAHRSADRFPHGQLYVDLRGYDARHPMRPAEALGVLLRALDVPPERIPDDLDEMAALYRARLDGQRVLVFLDNARSADQVRPLLPAARGTFVLVTSRDALGGLVARDGARRLHLDLLPPGDATRLLANIIGADRVRAEPDATAELAAACGYLPLALRIAAANLSANPHRGIAGYHAELVAGRRLPMLRVKGDPHSSLQPVFAYSYRALPAPARRLFRLLGLLPGPDFTVQWAAVLAGISPEEAGRLLASLLDAHLVSEPAAALTAEQGRRFAMHDLMREYAAELAAEPRQQSQRATAIGRVVDWAGRHVDAAARLLSPGALHLDDAREPVAFPDAAAASRWLEAEMPNLAALAISSPALGHPDLAWQVPFACRGFLFLRAGRSVMVRMAQAGLAAAVEHGDLRGQAASELTMAQAYNLAGHDPRALRHATRCLAKARAAGWPQIEVDALNAISVHHMHVGDLRASARAARAAFDRSTALGIPSTQYLGKLGLTSLLMGDLRDARHYLEQTLANQAGVASHSRGITLLNLGEAARLLGLLPAAHERITEAIALFEGVGSRYLAAVARSSLVLVHLAAGRGEAARTTAEAARAELEGSTDELARAQMWHGYGRVLAGSGRYAEAREVLESALPGARRLGNGYPAAQLMVALADVLRALCQPGVAAELADEAVRLAHEGQFAVLEADGLDLLARLNTDLGRTREAVAAAERALRVCERTGYTPGGMHAKAVLADAGRS